MGASTPVRADQVGSLLRPPDLLQAREEHARGALSTEELRELEDASILAALERQRATGVQVLSDGEFRRGSWITDMAAAVGGFVPQSRTIHWHGPGGGPEASTSQVVGGRLRQQRRLTAHESAFLLDHANGRFKVTVPAPSNFFLVSWKPGVSEAAYGSRTELLDDAVRVIRSEVEALIAEGVPYVQLDAPFYTTFIDEEERERLRQGGLDPEQALREAAAADNACVEGLARDGLTLALHVCRGNSRSRWLGEGPYDPIAETLLHTVQVNTFLLEYDAARHGGFEPLRFLPRDRVAVLGLVTTKEPRLESVDELKRRIDDAARYVPEERLALSPQCGFASVAAGNLLSEDDQWRKLDLVAETAHSVWGTA